MWFAGLVVLAVLVCEITGFNGDNVIDHGAIARWVLAPSVAGFAALVSMAQFTKWSEEAPVRRAWIAQRRLCPGKWCAQLSVMALTCALISWAGAVYLSGAVSRWMPS